MNSEPIDPSQLDRMHYRRFHNIFLYITEQCQLRCGHCYMGKRLDRGLILSYEQSQRIIKYWYNLGAKCITLLGGEPTLHPSLPLIVEYARKVGYKHVIIDTNGLNIKRIKEIPPKSLSYITVSLDGPSPAYHEKIRGLNTFNKTLASIKDLILLGYRVRINFTVFQFNLNQISSMLQMADDLGVSLVNFHTFSEEGNGVNNYDWALMPNDWIKFYEYINDISSNFNTQIWYPPTWSTINHISYFVEEGFKGCLGCSLDRVSIFPDGRCYICSVLFDQDIYFGTMTDTNFELNRDNNELEIFMQSMFQAAEPWLTGCPAEKLLKRSRSLSKDIVSMCRCWKIQAKK